MNSSTRNEADDAMPSYPSPLIVSTPSHLDLGAYDRGVTSFLVTNVSSRPVRARFLPRGQKGAADSWLSIEGEDEVLIGSGATVPVVIAVNLPVQVRKNVYALLLEIVPDGQPDQVARSQSVEFTPTRFSPPPSGASPLPSWIFIGGLALVVVVLLLAFLL